MEGHPLPAHSFQAPRVCGPLKIVRFFIWYRVGPDHVSAPTPFFQDARASGWRTAVYRAAVLGILAQDQEYSLLSKT